MIRPVIAALGIRVQDHPQLHGELRPAWAPQKVKKDTEWVLPTEPLTGGENPTPFEITEIYTDCGREQRNMGWLICTKVCFYSKSNGEAQVYF